MREPQNRSTGHRRRRTLALIAVSGAVLVAAAGPAVADGGDETDYLDINAPWEVVLPMADADTGAAVPRTVQLGVGHDNPDNNVTGGRITVDAGDIADVATVTWPAACTPDSVTPLVATCDFGAVGTWPYTDVAALTLRAKAGAPEGGSGYLHVSADADSDFGQLTTEPMDVSVTVGSGPDLSLNQLPRLKGVSPGTDVDQALRLSNLGNQTVDRTLLTFFASHGLDFVHRYANCSYAEDDQAANPTGTTAVCVVDQPAAPGMTYDLSAAAAVHAGSAALYERFDYSAQPYTDEAYEQALNGKEFSPGSGGELTLAPVTAARMSAAEEPAPDLDQGDNYRATTIQAVNTADLVAEGARVTGLPGDTVTTTVSVRNDGPAWVSSLFAGEPVALVDVTLPEGTTAVGAPGNCQGGGRTFRCHTPIYLWEKDSSAFTFSVRIDSLVPANAPGSISVVNDHDEPPVTDFDPDLTNNTAPITVAATG
ncbi:hypothetical protein ACIP98_34125 [Streptomyces sp. NPDC088354]|uniref:hypothetical protein n=1 Tax=Streptomyces sp. NPDC088354 TaxID=3365856 RepID=UPI00380BA35F